MPFDAMSEDFVEEDPGGASREQSRASVRIDDRSLAQGQQVRDHAFHGLDYRGVVRQTFRSRGRESLESRQSGAVRSPRAGGHRNLVHGLRGLHLSPFAVHQPSGLGAGQKRGAPFGNFRMAVERRAVLANLVFPSFPVGTQQRRFLRELLGLLAGKIVGLVFLSGADLGVGLHSRQHLQRTLVTAVGLQPEQRPKRLRIVLDGDLDAGGEAIRAASRPA